MGIFPLLGEGVARPGGGSAHPDVTCDLGDTMELTVDGDQEVDTAGLSHQGYIERKCMML